MKIQKKIGWVVGGTVWGVRVDVNEELKFLRKFTKKNSGGGGGWVRARGVFGIGGHSGCEVFVKIKKINWGGGGGRVGGVVRDGGSRWM